MKLSMYIRLQLIAGALQGEIIAAGGNPDRTPEGISGSAVDLGERTYRNLPREIKREIETEDIDYPGGRP